ncbi:ImmA/IrrE family metallo-endopeptidase [Methylobacterium goesingense]|uniref:IrrE N-terminal-like domain-containing protein n=1 Tax=Methylobacterium goesingense TaxID=243690 RepID=A0ABV2LAA7_9HYPH|nr:ImmA/IrrE family metallo-endopeptidase [Methylobacterium goesingense]GJD76167.1 hypothetical protein CFIICLFH_4417 [Methylobacterium goesingense]
MVTKTIDPMAIVARHQTSAPVNLEMIARDLSIRVYKEHLGSSIAGKIVRQRLPGGSYSFAISVNMADHPNRQRFTLAHEIAHYILHRDLIESELTDNTLYRSELSGTYEAQANRLAADILMPIPLLRSLRKQYPTTSALAKQFKVSEEAMRIRLETVSLNQYSLF